MVVDMSCDYLWCNCLIRLPSKVTSGRTRILVALEDGGNEIDSLRYKHFVDCLQQGSSR